MKTITWAKINLHCRILLEERIISPSLFQRAERKKERVGLSGVDPLASQHRGRCMSGHTHRLTHIHAYMHTHTHLHSPPHCVCRRYTNTTYLRNTDRNTYCRYKYSIFIYIAYFYFCMLLLFPPPPFPISAMVDGCRSIFYQGLSLQYPFTVPPIDPQPPRWERDGQMDGGRKEGGEEKKGGMWGVGVGQQGQKQREAIQGEIKKKKRCHRLLNHSGVSWSDGGDDGFGGGEMVEMETQVSELSALWPSCSAKCFSGTTCTPNPDLKETQTPLSY